MTALATESLADSAIASGTRPLRAVIYARVSSDPKKQEKSVTDQVNEGTRECNERGWIIARVFKDNDRSASRHAKKERPEYVKLIEFLRSGGADVLVTWESSRAQRDLEAYVKLRKICAECNVQWCYKGRVHDLSRTDDRFTTGLDALLAEREADEVKDRVMRGQKDSAERGRPPGRILFGYQREYDPRTKAFIRQAIREDQAVIVREVIRRYAAGESKPSIRIDLNQRGLTTGTGKPWNDRALARMVTNYSYLGKRIYQGKVIRDGLWPPIIEKAKDVQAFYACVRRIERGRLLHQRDGSSKYLLTGIAKCGTCGGRLKSIPSPRSVKRSYVCGGTPAHRGQCVTIRIERLDAYVTEWILERLSRPDAGGLLAGDPEDDDTAEAMAEADQLRARLDEFTDAAAAGDVTPAALARIESQLLPKIEAAEKRAQSVTVSPVLQDMIRPDIADVWPGLPISQQREVVRTLVNVSLHKAQVKGRVKFDPSRVEITWRQDL